MVGNDSYKPKKTNSLQFEESPVTAMLRGFQDSIAIIFYYLKC